MGAGGRLHLTELERLSARLGTLALQIRGEFERSQVRERPCTPLVARPPTAQTLTNALLAGADNSTVGPPDG